MLSIVPCSENKCIYHSEGMCRLDTAKSPAKIEGSNKNCVYFCTKDFIERRSVNSDNPAQNQEILIPHT